MTHDWRGGTLAAALPGVSRGRVDGSWYLIVMDPMVEGPAPRGARRLDPIEANAATAPPSVGFPPGVLTSRWPAGQTMWRTAGRTDQPSAGDLVSRVVMPAVGVARDDSVSHGDPHTGLADPRRRALLR